MKTKKALAVILAVVMTITLMPSMAFATSDSTVKSVPTVAASDEMPAVSINIEVKDKVWDEGEAQTVKFTFKNAKWTTNPAEGTVANASKIKEIELSNNVSLKEIVSVTDESIEFTFVPTSELKKGDVVTVNFPTEALTSGSEDGAVEIAIDGQDSYVSSKTLTVATVGSSNTTASVNGSVKTFGRINGVPVGTKVEIRETAVNSITTDQVLKLTLPKGVSWDSVTLSGNLLNGDGDAMQTKVTTKADDVDAAGEYYLSNDGRSVYIFVTVDNNAAVRQVLGITGEITIGKTASEGDITVDVTCYKTPDGGNGISDASDLVIAKYGEEAVTVSTVDEDDLPTVYAGFVKTNKDKYNWIQLTIKEAVKDSLQSGRYIDIELPEEVQVVEGQPITTTLKKDPKLKDAAKKSALAEKFISWDDDKDRSEFTITVPDDNELVGAGETWNASKANTWNIFIPVTVEADFAGDIELTATGAKAGIEETTLTVAKAESPVKVETKSTEVKNGIQKQNLADITITENAVGYMNAGTTLAVDLDNLGLKNALVFDDADVKVTAGDLEIGKVKISEGVITIPIKEESTKVSTITISNISATLNRTLPEGKYDLLIGGTLEKAKSALIDNENYNDEEFDVTPVTVKGYIDIVTPANTTTTKINAQFVIGQTTYTNNGQSVTMDAAPYIDSNSRTMVPIRYVANACGVSDNNIVWNGATQTATMSGANTVVTIKVGASTIATSTGTITMDTVAVNKDGRIYVPLRFIANAFGAEVAWDQAAQTASIMK